MDGEVGVFDGCGVFSCGCWVRDGVGAIFEHRCDVLSCFRVFAARHGRGLRSRGRATLHICRRLYVHKVRRGVVVLVWLSLRGLNIWCSLEPVVHNYCLSKDLSAVPLPSSEEFAEPLLDPDVRLLFGGSRRLKHMLREGKCGNLYCFWRLVFYGPHSPRLGH